MKNSPSFGFESIYQLTFIVMAACSAKRKVKPPTRRRAPTNMIRSIKSHSKKNRLRRQGTLWGKVEGAQRNDKNQARTGGRLDRPTDRQRDRQTDRGETERIKRERQRTECSEVDGWTEEMPQQRKRWVGARGRGPKAEAGLD